jgi:hypothetical protein
MNSRRERPAVEIKKKKKKENNMDNKFLENLFDEASSRGAIATKTFGTTKDFKDQQEFISFVQAVVHKKGEITRNKLLTLIYNHGRRTCKDLEAIHELVIGPCIVKGDKGIIEVRGNGMQGYLGKGPTIYKFKKEK